MLTRKQQAGTQLYLSGRFLQHQRARAGLKEPHDDLPDLVARVSLREESGDVTGADPMADSPPDIDEKVKIQGHWVRFATVNLSGPSRWFRNRLLELVQPWAIGQPPIRED